MHKHLAMRTACAALLIVGLIAIRDAIRNSAHADEDGVSFWIPGFFGSLAAAPQLSLIHISEPTRRS